MQQYIEVRGRLIAVHAKTGAQLKWLRDNYMLRTNAELDAMAADTASKDAQNSSNAAALYRHKIALERRSQFRIV